ncbi:MAG: DUF5063 domain-containing protein [Opitutaceae bacterium]
MNHPSVDGFIAAAEKFCEISVSLDPIKKEDLWCIRELLLLLVFHVPAVESHQQAADFDGKRISEEEFIRAVKRFGDLPFDFYRVVFDPHDFEAEDEPVHGMLADDLSDIYRDISEGLDNVRNGHLDDACFDWSQSYSSHWARHAVNALAAIEIYRTDNYKRV